jgi:hypothetical protein
LGNISGGQYVFKNGFFKGNFTGFLCFDTKSDFINCTILDSLEANSNIISNFSEINLINCNLHCVSQVNILSDENSTIYIQDSILKTDNVLLGANIITSGTTPVIVIANSQLINGLPLGGGQFCIYAGSLLVGETLDIRIQGVCVATFPTSTQIVNIITGTNIIASVNAITVPRNKLP